MPKKTVMTLPGAQADRALLAGRDLRRAPLRLRARSPLDPETGEIVAGDVSAQTEQVMKNLMAVLKEAKMGPENVVKTTVYLADMADFPKMNEVYGRYFGKEPPARSTIQAAALPARRQGRDRPRRGVLEA